MPNSLAVSIGQFSSPGVKEDNQDFHGALIPTGADLSLKGVAVAIADGISSSPVSRIAAESAIKSFLTDYYCTPESWTVPTSAQRVINAVNSWLHSQSRAGQCGHDRDKGYVTTFSALVLKSRMAHLFHVGDSRISRLEGKSLEQLTIDHRVEISSQQSYLGRALGVNPHVEIDYRALPLSPGDVFVLATDGVYDWVTAPFVAGAIGEQANDLDQAARNIVCEALANGSQDNLTIQILRVDGLPDGEGEEILGRAADLPLPPLLEARMEFDGFRIIRQIHASSRSHAYLAEDLETGGIAVIKIPSIDLRGDAAYLKRFMMEEWIARRLNSANVLKTFPRDGRRTHLYVVSEFVDGQTLTQWMIDHPRPDVETVRGLLEQIAVGLRAFHRKEMVHQDLRPENIMIDRDGTVKIIDFGSAKVAGVLDAAPDLGGDALLGTAQYSAPEYFLGQSGTWRSDQFSLGVIAYQMLTGKLPYGAQVAKTRTPAQQRRLNYRPASAINPEIPVWVDSAIHKAVAIDPARRHEALSEFLYYLRHPDTESRSSAEAALSERNPVRAWQLATLFLALTVLFLITLLAR